MAVVIRLTATGKKHRISYRIVATDRQNKRDGKIVENLGFYNPNVRVEDGYKLDEDRYKYWLSQGAKASPAVIEIIEGKGVRPVKPKKKKPEPKTEETAPATKPETKEEAEKTAEEAPESDSAQEPATEETVTAEAETAAPEAAAEAELEPEKPAEQPAAAEEEKTAEKPKA